MRRRWTNPWTVYSSPVLNPEGHGIYRRVLYTDNPDVSGSIYRFFSLREAVQSAVTNTVGSSFSKWVVLDDNNNVIRRSVNYC